MAHWVLIVVCALLTKSVTAELTCGNGETEVNCPAHCPSDYCPKFDGEDNVPCPTPMVCPDPACKCRFNYRRENGTCIPTRNCPPFPCYRPNEEYNPCPPLCPSDSCSQATPTGRCRFRIGIILQCKPKCRCIKGYWRDNGICVPYAECPNIANNSTEVIITQVNNTPQSATTTPSQPTDATGTAAEPSDTSSSNKTSSSTDNSTSIETSTSTEKKDPICSDNEVVDKCPANCASDRCPKSESEALQTCTQPDPCPAPACKCAFNYRRADNGTCIPTRSCPPFACDRPNEVFNPCPPLCPTDDCSQASPSGECPQRFGFIGIVLPCSPKCRCKKGYWRRDGVCVPYVACSTDFPDNGKSTAGETTTSNDDNNNNEVNDRDSTDDNSTSNDLTNDATNNDDFNSNQSTSNDSNSDNSSQDNSSNDGSTNGNATNNYSTNEYSSNGESSNDDTTNGDSTNNDSTDDNYANDDTCNTDQRTNDSVEKTSYSSTSTSSFSSSSTYTSSSSSSSTSTSIGKSSGSCKGQNEEFIKEKRACPPETCLSLVAKFNCLYDQPLKSGCACKSGFLRVNGTSPCIPICDCPQMINSPKCQLKCNGPNEEYVQEKRSCPPETCMSLVAKYKCASDQLVEPGCACKPGFLRLNKTSPCIPTCQCPQMASSPDCQPKCDGPNEEYVQEKRSCPPETCMSLVAKYKCASDQLVEPGCACKPGFLRLNKTSPCIPTCQCPQMASSPDCQPKCDGPNEEYVQEKRSCPPETCMSLVAKYKCASDQLVEPGCACKPGFLRLNKTSPCIPTCQCPQMASSPDCLPKCDGTNEEYVTEKQSCPPELCKSIVSRYDCSKAPPPEPGCACKSGFYRVNETSPCVPICECPEMSSSPDCQPKCDGPNEEYVQEKRTCPPQTCFSVVARFDCRNTPPPKPGCACKSGYLRVNETSPCIPSCECKELKNTSECQ